MPHFLQVKQDLLPSRYFNQLSVEPVAGILRKTSTRVSKLQDEFDWYHDIPDELKVMTPRVWGLEVNDQTCTFYQEYHDYPNLAALYLNSDFDIGTWNVVIQHLIKIHLQFKAFPGPVSPEDAHQMYWTKTAARLYDLTADDAYFRDLTNLDRINLNGQWLDNLPRLKNGIKVRCEKLAYTIEGAVIHGDFCLSNMLYDINNQLVRLIDPRGRFGRKGIYGDPRYDMAKLRHSLHGMYDFIVADLFTIEKTGDDHFKVDINSREWHHEAARFFDGEIVQIGYSLDDICFIEALLFLSMIPLHRDNLGRQIIMYLQSIKMFNNLRPT